MRIKEENQTLATVTLQNYFRMYDKLAGMTGTAVTEAAELMSTYTLQVVPIPPHRPLARADQADLIFRTEEAKFNAVADDIEERNATGQPILVGTTSVEKSERLARVLEKRGVAHHVLNAKQHTKEAEIVTQAGRVGAVTVATNMAGRGVDILLGAIPTGSPNVSCVPRWRPVSSATTSCSAPGPTTACLTWTGSATTPSSSASRSCRPSSPSSARPRARRSVSSAASTCWAPSATSHAASTTSCAVVRVVRATPARAGST
ncbi:MAG: hypothetical protein M5U19_22915 [Microthrixaceae bacterium]|nr:hypothetical protein [Microthrixaceae bacterium]